MVGVTPEMQHLILSRNSSDKIRVLAKEQNYRTLRENEFLKAYKGITNVDEVLRVTAE